MSELTKLQMLLIFKFSFQRFARCLKMSTLLSCHPRLKINQIKIFNFKAKSLTKVFEWQLPAQQVVYFAKHIALIKDQILKNRILIKILWIEEKTSQLLLKIIKLSLSLWATITFSIQYFKILLGNLLPNWCKKLKNTSKKSCPRNKLNEEDWYDVECQSLENNDIIDNDNQDESRKKVVACCICRSF